jgi:hypothetical protein
VVNSLCYDDPFAECPLGGKDNPFSYSEHRNHCLDNLKRYLSATREPHQCKRGCLHLITFADSTFCANTLYSLRQRQVQAEEYSTFKCFQEPVYGSVAICEIQSFEHDRISTEQLARINELTSKHRKQILWTPDAIGKVSEEYRDFFLRMCIL